MAFGLDYVTGPPVADLKAAGVTFVCRYLSEVNNLTQIKLLTPAEAKTLGAAGISIISNYEWYANRALEGAASGVADAQTARDQHTACGGPADRPIYFSVDFDAAGPEVADYFRGVASVIGLARTGAYGSYRVIKYLFDNGLIQWGWQTYAWSGGAWEPRAHIQQYSNGITLAGHSVDYNHSMKSDFGQWFPQGQGGTTTSTIELLSFPMISQRDGDANQNYDCVAASIAACMQWLTGQHYTAREIKDAVYGAGYVGGTAAIKYVDYCAAHGVALAPVDGNGAQLVQALHSAIAKQTPCLITEPDPYSAGWTHVCAAYKTDGTTITVMDPWIDAPVTKSDAQWALQLQDNQIWTLEKKMSGIPQNWKDDGTTLTAPNDVKVVLGFRDYILTHTWDPADVPMAPEGPANPVEIGYAQPSGPQSGTRQIFAYSELAWTAARGVYKVSVGRELYTALQKLASIPAPAPQPALNLVDAIATLQGLGTDVATKLAQVLKDLGVQ